ncbi:hypothetical protein ZIOFF_027104 [Zingiber officinale]|uniref:Uncharacterized protein n=1 Tax=Zingiber officinale TaxID=94328 RepID=A0A8J5HHI3_ZINOF|nr:hypothetical protein ZIOFF_027104 [Zingiber officinale]
MIHLQEQKIHHIKANELEVGIPQMVQHVLLPPREEIVHHDDAVPPRDQAVHQMVPHEPDAASDHDRSTFRSTKTYVELRYEDDEERRSPDPLRPPPVRPLHPSLRDKKLTR